MASFESYSYSVKAFKIDSDDFYQMSTYPLNSVLGDLGFT